MTGPDPVGEFFAGDDVGLAVYERVAGVLPDDDVEVRTTRSQVAFRRRRGFAWLWRPDRWLRGGVAPVVVSVSLPRRDASRRWKQVAHPTSSVWMHHLEVRDPAEIDGQVVGWLREAYDAAR